jgi:hypothetical protein
MKLLHSVEGMAEFEGAVLIGSEGSEYPRIDIIHSEVSSVQHSIRSSGVRKGLKLLHTAQKEADFESAVLVGL